MAKRCTKCGGPGPFDKCSHTRDRLQSWCRPCSRASIAAWKKRNREKVNASRARWRARYPEKAKAQAAAWWASHPEKVRAKNAAYRATHLEEEKARHRARYEKNGEEIRAQSAAWRRANPERARAARLAWQANNRDARRALEQKREARKARLPATLTVAEWRAILEYFGHACAYCLRTNIPLQQEHVVPLSDGGPYTAENIVPACGRCNAQKKDRPIWTMLRKAA